MIISASNESQVTSSETKLGVYDDFLRGEGLDYLRYAPRYFFLSLQSWMNNFICPDLSQITCQLLGIESSWKLTIDSLKRKAQRSNVCTFTDIAKLGEVHQGYQNQVVSQELKTTKNDSQSRMVFQNRTTILVDLKIER